MFGGKRLGVLVQTPKRFIFSFFPLHFRAKCTTFVHYKKMNGHEERPLPTHSDTLADNGM